jgi:hypothetical protein
MPDWYDPFGEPNTIPCGWDLSGLDAANPAPGQQPESARRQLLELFYRLDLNPN